MSTRRFTLGSVLRLVVVLVISVGALVWTLRDVSAGEVWDATLRAELGWIVLGLAFFLASFAIRAIRWGTLLGARHDPGSFGVRHACIYIGFAGNCVFPAHAGELVRAYALNRRTKIPFEAVLGSIFTERLLDAAVAFLFLFVPLLSGAVTPAPDADMGLDLAIWLGGALGLVIGGALVAARWPRLFSRLAGRITAGVGLKAVAPKIEGWVAGLLSGLEVLRDPRRGLRALGESFAIWTLTAMTYWFALLAFGVRGPGPVAGFFVQGVAAVGIAIPSTPGYFGPYEAATRLALEAYGVAPDTIVAYAIVTHLMVFLSVTAIGFACAARLGVSWTARPVGPAASGAHE